MLTVYHLTIGITDIERITSNAYFPLTGLLCLRLGICFIQTHLYVVNMNLLTALYCKRFGEWTYYMTFVADKLFLFMKGSESRLHL